MKELFHWRDDVNGMMDVELEQDKSLFIYTGSKNMRDEESWQYCKFTLDKDNIKAVAKLASILNSWVASNS